MLTARLSFLKRGLLVLIDHEKLVKGDPSTRKGYNISQRKGTQVRSSRYWGVISVMLQAQDPEESAWILPGLAKAGTRKNLSLSENRSL